MFTTSSPSITVEVKHRKPQAILPTLTINTTITLQMIVHIQALLYNADSTDMSYSGARKDNMDRMTLDALMVVIWKRATYRDVFSGPVAG